MMVFRARHSSTGDRVTCLNVNAEMSLILTEQKNVVIVFLKKKTNFGKSKCPRSPGSSKDMIHWLIDSYYKSFSLSVCLTVS